MFSVFWKRVLQNVLQGSLETGNHAPMCVPQQDEILALVAQSSSQTVETLEWLQVFLFCVALVHKLKGPDDRLWRIN